MSDTIDQHIRLFKALSDPTRIRILQLLPDEPVCQQMYNVNELVDEIGGSQPNMSRHLQILKDAGLVDCRKKCCSVYYYRLPDAFRQAVSLLETLQGPASH